ncbi:MAG: 1,4-dihydroxy-2-naphthoate polyprenyltransferase [Planctomycetota bacterium]|nr:1,4-dihydroxy-2-naphthoate polyprenyltransferase [Planctomycetota bacterium]
MIFDWILAARPKTLLAALSPVSIGAALALHDGSFHLWAMLGALVSAMSVQVGTNFCNDYCDFFQGADTEERKGPTRAVQAGLISPRAMLIATVMMFSVTAVAACLVSLRAGWGFMLLGAVSILLGVLYTAGRYSLAYLGIADPFVLVFFGPVAVAGTHYVQSLQLSFSSVIAGLGPGLIATGLLVVNNLRDIDEDRTANKRTLAVRLGATFSRFQYTLCVVGAALVPIWFAGAQRDKQSWATALACLIVVPGVVVISKVWRNDGLKLRLCLGMTAGLLLLYTLLFCLGLWLS